jgi:prevent-host-death family protein
MEWRASEARHRFSQVVDAAIEGKPQYIRRRDGREVVLLSRELYERIQPNLKNYLMTAGYAGDEDDAFDRAMRTVREGSPMLGPRDVDLKD